MSLHDTLNTIIKYRESIKKSNDSSMINEFLNFLKNVCRGRTNISVHRYSWKDEISDNISNLSDIMSRRVMYVDSKSKFSCNDTKFRIVYIDGYDSYISYITDRKIKNECANRKSYDCKYKDLSKDEKRIIHNRQIKDYLVRRYANDEEFRKKRSEKAKIYYQKKKLERQQKS